jgi:phosphatidylserine/phosphatidylglycerophosphate/cardiolipin synthase-like enzyme
MALSQRIHLHYRFAAALLAAALWAAGCTPPASPPLQGSPLAPPGEAIQVFFTDPESPGASSYRGGPDQDLADAIDQARLSVDMAVLDLNLWSLRDALIAAHRRGAAVRLVVDSDYLDEDEVQEIKAAGIPVLGDRRESLMHNKFTVIDRQEVWTGSLNYTISDGYRNNNNLLRLRSVPLAESYTREFDEMFVEDAFGAGSPANTPNPLVQVDGARVEIYFSPDDGAAERLVELVQGAQDSVYFLAYSFTLDELADALIERGQAGVRIAGVMEASQVESNTGSDFDRFAAAGLDVRLDGNPRNMHHKVLIIDETIVVTGSYNFSRSAETRNDENTLVIFDPEIADFYLEEFKRMEKVAEKR